MSLMFCTLRNIKPNIRIHKGTATKLCFLEICLEQKSEFAHAVLWNSKLPARQIAMYYTMVY